MLRVYFDWNIFSYIKQRKDTEAVYKSLYNIIGVYKDDVLFPYSRMHLNDLKRGDFTSEKGKMQTYEDLSFLAEISQSNYLEEGYNENGAALGIRDPIEYFEEIIAEDLSIDIDNLFGEDDEESKMLSNLFKSTLKSIPSDLNLEGVDNLPEKYQKLKDLFKHSRTDSSSYGLFKDVLELLSAFEGKSDIYKSIRNAGIDELKINTDPHLWGKPFDYLNKVFRRSKINKTIDEILAESTQNSKDKAISRFQNFVQYYMSLDIFGYHKDKKLPNLIDDATHAYYAAHCDFFVTEDENTYHKAKAIYERFNIETIVCKAAEFPLELKKIYDIEGVNRENFITNVRSAMQNTLHLGSDAEGISHVYKINKYLIAYFNRMQVTEDVYLTTFLFYKRGKNYSDFISWIEIKSIVDKISLSIGRDINNRLEFKEEEQVEILEDKWLGRLWHMESLEIYLHFLPAPFGLTFQIAAMKQAAYDEINNKGMMRIFKNWYKKIRNTKILKRLFASNFNANAKID